MNDISKKFEKIKDKLKTHKNQLANQSKILGFVAAATLTGSVTGCSNESKQDLKENVSAQTYDDKTSQQTIDDAYIGYNFQPSEFENLKTKDQDPAEIYKDVYVYPVAEQFTIHTKDLLSHLNKYGYSVWRDSEKKNFYHIAHQNQELGTVESAKGTVKRIALNYDSELAQWSRSVMDDHPYISYITCHLSGRHYKHFSYDEYLKADLDQVCPPLKKATDRKVTDRSANKTKEPTHFDSGDSFELPAEYDALGDAYRKQQKRLKKLMDSGDPLEPLGYARYAFDNKHKKLTLENPRETPQTDKSSTDVRMDKDGNMHVMLYYEYGSNKTSR